MLSCVCALLSYSAYLRWLSCQLFPSVESMYLYSEDVFGWKYLEKFHDVGSLCSGECFCVMCVCVCVCAHVYSVFRVKDTGRKDEKDVAAAVFIFTVNIMPLLSRIPF